MREVVLPRLRIFRMSSKSTSMKMREYGANTLLMRRMSAVGAIVGLTKCFVSLVPKRAFGVRSFQHPSPTCGLSGSLVERTVVNTHAQRALFLGDK